MGYLSIARIDSIEARRELLARMAKHPIGTTAFILWLILACALGVFTATVIATDDALNNSPVAVHPNTLLLGIILLLVGKSIIDANYRVVENKELIFLMIQPVNPTRILLNKFVSLVISNLGIMGVTVGTFLGVYYAMAVRRPELLTDLPIEPWYIATFLILILFASGLGFVFAHLNSLTAGQRFATVPAYSLMVYLLNVGLRDYRLEGWPAIAFALGMSALAIGSVRAVVPIFPQLWSTQTAGKDLAIIQKKTTRRWFDLLGGLRRIFPPAMAHLVYKELLINIQKKEVVGNLVAILGLSGLLLYFYDLFRTSELVEGSLLPLVYPIIISLGIYLAALLQCGLIGLGSVGKEGKKFWILRSAPVAPEQVFKAKAIAILALTPLTVGVITVPLPLLLEMPMRWLVFFIVQTVAMVCAFTGIGLWAGATFPNFDEGRGGTPDVMSMYLLSLLCLGIGVFMLGGAGFALAGPPFGPPWGGFTNGVLATVLSLQAGIAILLWGILRGARRFAALEVSFS